MGYYKNLSIEQTDNRRLMNSVRGYRKRSGNLPFELTLESSSEIDKFDRAQDKESLRKFNKDVDDWAQSSKNALRASIKSMVKRDVYLSDSLKANLYYDTKYAREVNRVGFSFAREGVFIHKGAGRGQGGEIGSSWIDRFGRKKSRDPSSAGLQGTGNRKPIPWFDPVIEKRLPQLADIVANYSATMQINATNIFIDDRP